MTWSVVSLRVAPPRSGAAASDARHLRGHLGTDLWRLAHSGTSPLTGVTILSRPARAARGTFRLTFADGSVAKGRRCEHRRQAERIQELAVYLDPRHFPRIHRRDGCALLEEWVEGRSLSGTADDGVFERGGAMLASLHSVDVPQNRRLAARSYVEASGLRVVQGVARLVRMNAITKEDGAAARELATSQRPRDLAPALIHGDFCGDNMVLDANERVRLVDNESVIVHVPQYDLARTWYRWPMSGRQRAAFEHGYGDSPALAGFRTSFGFWAVVVLVESALFRLRVGAGESEIPLQRLRQLLREGRASLRA
jgi:hypothetical protein